MLLVELQGLLSVLQDQVAVLQDRTTVILGQVAVSQDRRTVLLALAEVFEPDLVAAALVVPSCLLQVEESVEVELLAGLQEGQLLEPVAVLQALVVVQSQEVQMAGLQVAQVADLRVAQVAATELQQVAVVVEPVPLVLPVKEESLSA